MRGGVPILRTMAVTTIAQEVFLTLLGRTFLYLRYTFFVARDEKMRNGFKKTYEFQREKAKGELTHIGRRL